MSNVVLDTLFFVGWFLLDTLFFVGWLLCSSAVIGGAFGVLISYLERNSNGEE